jgi:hypothetical protein
MGKMGGNAAWNQIGSKKDWRQAMALKGIPSGEKTGTWGESFETGSEQLLRTRINTMAKEIAENLAVHITKNPPEFIRLKTEIEQTIINWFGSDLKKAYLKTLSPHLAFEIYGAITNISPKIELNVVSQIMKRLAYYGKIHLYELNPDETYRMSQEDKENQHAFVFDSNHKLYYVGGEETHVDAIVKNPELESLFSDDETFEDREFVMSKGLLLGRIYKDTISIWNSNPLLNKLLVPCLQALLDKKLIAYGYHVFTPHHDAETVEKILSKKVKTTAPANASWKAAAQLPHLISPMNKVGGDAAWHQLGKGKDWRQAMTARGLTPGSGTGIWGESFKEWLQKNK